MDIDDERRLSKEHAGEKKSSFSLLLNFSGTAA